MLRHPGVFGLDVPAELRAIKSRIGVCQQENTLDPDLTVQQNLEVFARYFDIPGDQAHEKARGLLHFIALDHRKNAKVNELSGGMMRRLVLARALINDPELLILDEPTTGLDSILLTTHYMDEASRLCDRLIIMDHGRILVQGTPLELIREHVGHDVIEVAGPNDEMRTYVQSQGLEHEDLGHRLIVYGQEGDVLFRTLSSQYCREGCILRMATLEDVFLKLTGRELRE